MDSSSSDGSFAWTDASSDSIESTTMIEDKKNERYSDDESVSGKTYKKKLQDELFAKSNGDVEKPHESHKRKRKLTEHSQCTEQASPKKKKIKKEPESDVDIATKERKINGKSTESYDESYLDLKVKAEVQYTPPSLTKTKRNKSKNNSIDIQNEDFKKWNGEESEAEENKLDELVQQEIDQHEKKKKKKKKKTKRRDDSDVHSEANHTDSQIEEHAANNSFHQSTEESDVTVSEQVASVKHKKKSKQLSRDDDRNSILKPAPEAHKPSIPDRIQFEDDDSSDNQTSQLQSNKTLPRSTNMKKFLKNNLNLKPSTSSLTAESALTADEEIWVLRCPKEVDINAFKNKDITLEGKCKLKLNSQTYEGIVDSERMNMSILSSEHSNFVIKNLSVKGCLNLCKRIPKIHIVDKALVSNPSNFIPLPETKCRHPLFGVNYRKAIKLPSEVAQRLRAPASPERSEPAPPKPEPAASGDSDHPVTTKKRKKKSKHSDSEEIAPKKKKRAKHDLESAEAWESEQAIEENLFNF